MKNTTSMQIETHRKKRKTKSDSHCINAEISTNTRTCSLVIPYRDVYFLQVNTGTHKIRDCIQIQTIKPPRSILVKLEEAQQET
jgi:hypothetical protein